MPRLRPAALTAGAGPAAPAIVTRADLSRRPLPSAPPAFHGTRSAYIECHLEPLLPDARVVEAFHRALVGYLGQPDTVHLVRAVAGLERGVPVVTRDGGRLVPGDNSPAWWWHALLFNGLAVDPARFASLIVATPSHMFQAPARGETLNARGWYVAHILGVKNRDVRWQGWPRREAVWRFVRNIHPCNTFYVPRTPAAWVGISADAGMLASVADYYRRRYASVWDEFCQLADAPTGHGDPAPDGRLDIDGPLPASATTRAVPPAAARTLPRPPAAARAPGWPEILRPGAPTSTGALLARDPNAAALTARLAEGLTVARLIAIADTMFNRCRASDMEAAAPGDPLRQAALAWSALLEGANKRHIRPSGWTGTARLLDEGQAEGLAAVSRMDIAAIARVGARIVAETYSWATAHGIR